MRSLPKADSMRRKILSLTIFLSAALLAFELSASILRAVTFRDMMGMSDALVRAVVQDKEALYKTFRYVDDFGRESESENIYTRYGLVIKDVLYGEDSGRSIDLYLPGGIVGEEGRWVSTAFQLESGWDIVVHLQRDELNDVYFSAGSAQTVFLAREVEGEEVFINLIDEPRMELNREALSTMRTGIGLDDWVRAEEPALVSYESLKEMFSEVE